MAAPFPLTQAPDGRGIVWDTDGTVLAVFPSVDEAWGTLKRADALNPITTKDAA